MGGGGARGEGERGDSSEAWNQVYITAPAEKFARARLSTDFLSTKMATCYGERVFV